MILHQNVIFYFNKKLVTQCWIIKVWKHSKNWSHFRWKPFIGDFFYKFWLETKWGHYAYFELLIMLKYSLCWLICAESDENHLKEKQKIKTFQLTSYEFKQLNDFISVCMRIYCTRQECISHSPWLVGHILHKPRMHIPRTMAIGICILDECSIFSYNPTPCHPVIYK